MTRSSLSSGTRPSLPADLSDALGVVDGLTGSRPATMAMLYENRMVGNAGVVGGAPVRLAQAGTMTMPGGAGAIPRGALRLGGNILTAAQVMNDIHSSIERARTLEAIARFGLDHSRAADVLSARAYVWARFILPLDIRFWSRVPYDTDPLNDRIAQAVMRYERAHPGTAGAASRSDAAALAAIDQVVNQAIAADAAIAGALVVERTSKESPALSASSTRARTILSIQNNQWWQAHHLVPFAVVARLPTSVQQAIAASGWRMDSASNLIALPANFATYLVPNFRSLPYHSGSHGARYDNDVWAALQPLAAGATTMRPAALRSAMDGVAARFRVALRSNRLYHPRLN